MLYSRRSWVALGVWLRYGVARGHALQSWSDLLSKHMESPGTKAYTQPELVALFSDFDGPVDEASVSVPLAHKRALFCGERSSKGGARTRDGLVRLRSARRPWNGRLSTRAVRE